MHSRIEMMKRLDVLIGRIGACCLPAPSRTGTVSAPRRFLVIRPGGIGDAVLLIPALVNIREKFPDAHISVLAERRNAAVFGLCPAVDLIARYDVPSEFFGVLRARYDVVIDTEQWHRLSAVVARMVRSPVKIGYGSNERGRLFTHPVAYAQDDYEVKSFFDLLGPLGMDMPVDVPIPFLFPPDAARRKAAHLLEAQSGTDFIALFPGASIPERRWGAEKFRDLIGRIAASGVSAVVVGGPGDEAEGARCAGTYGLNLAGTCSLAETAAIVERAAVLVSGDSGVLHLGVGLGVPTVSLFGPGRQLKWGPRGPGHVVINHHLECSPCTTWGTTPPCPRGARCLAEITVDEVERGIMQLLEEKMRGKLNKILDEFHGG